MPYHRQRRHSCPTGELPLYHGAPLPHLDTVQEGAVLFPPNYKPKKGKRFSFSGASGKHDHVSELAIIVRSGIGRFAPRLMSCRTNFDTVKKYLVY